MSRSALLISAVWCISCAGSHANDAVGTGTDAAADEIEDASSQAHVDAIAQDAGSHADGTFADATTPALDGGDAAISDAAQSLNDAGDAAVSLQVCRQQADCPTGSTCRSPDYAAAPCRGIACRAQVVPGCTQASDCGSGARCHVLQDLLCYGEYYRSCAAPCSKDADCMGTRCQADGTCLPAQHCSVTKSCPTFFHCDAQLGSAATGCVRDSCRADSECDGGVCLFEQCHASVGVCRAPDAPCLAP